MSTIPLKVVRKKLVHEAVLDKIDREMRNMPTLSVLLSESERLRVLDLLIERTRE
ncbi:hypothetical protein SAMN02799641_04285 [Rhodococcus erythropolis]|uniref:hypothetical protein n=1 Tax=Rhodococcus erythropolis TaxID=1833 RepID=UPI000306CA63|nr:hypothetical protein [Rhodococcus erythropolis]SCZ00519.1 hypothetical protein SAMN02799641_04285 [Rhodococcus erythropolis]